MELVAREENNVFEICDGIITKMSPKTFITEFLMNSVMKESDDVSVFVAQLGVWGNAIVNTLKAKGLKDATNSKGGGALKPKENEFNYIVAAKTNTWFSIFYNINGNIVSIYAYENMIPIDESTILKDFGEEGDTLTTAMFNALTEMRRLGCKHNTISSSSYHIWKDTYNKYDFKKIFREPTEEEYEFIKNAHHGGLCYVNHKGSVGRGIVLDVNSLYPYEMRSKRFPVGKPKVFKGEIPEAYEKSDVLTYYVNFTCKFKVKENHVPFVRAMNDDKYSQNNILTTSSVIDKITGEEYDELVDDDGVIYPVRANLYMFKEEFHLFQEQYDIEDLQIVECYGYFAAKGVFDKFIDRYMYMKEHATNKSERRIAKMLMNSTSGNLAKKKKRDSVCFGDEATIITTKSRTQSHIVLGAAITSYGMCDIVRHAQANYDHFLYTDTDSLHLDCDIQDVVGVEIDDKMLGAFKLEHTFESATYVKQKVYYFKENGETIVKWSGMREEQRNIIAQHLNNGEDVNGMELEYHIYCVSNFDTMEKEKITNKYRIDIA